MVEREESRLTAILKAASDPTRRAILTLLAQHGPTRVTDLAGRFEISLNAISKHIRALEGAGLVTRRTIWREHMITVDLAALAEIERWFNDLRSIWEIRLDALETALKEDPMNDVAEDLTLTVSRTIPAAPDRVFRAWLDPALLARFMRPMGVTATATNDPRIGGRFDIVMRRDDKDIAHWGHYTEIAPPRRLAFTWQSPNSVEGSTVTIDFTEVPEGTRVDLTQVRFRSEDERRGHESGWTDILGLLEAALA